MEDSKAKVRLEVGEGPAMSCRDMGGPCTSCEASRGPTHCGLRWSAAAGWDDGSEALWGEA